MTTTMADYYKIQAGRNEERACPHCGEDLLWWVPPHVHGRFEIRCCKCSVPVRFDVTSRGGGDAEPTQEEIPVRIVSDP